MSQTQELFVQPLPNGLVLLGESMSHVASTAVTFHVPAGAACDPPGLRGAAAIACEWWMRGAGDRDERELYDALDTLGCHHDTSVQSEFLTLEAAQLARTLPDVMAILADIVRRPTLGDDTFGPCRDLALQDLAGLDDEPARRCHILLRERFFPSPLGCCAYGTPEGLTHAAPESVRSFLAGHLRPGGAILAVAGQIDWNEFVSLAEDLLGDWTAPASPPTSPTPVPNAPSIHQLPETTSQTHIGLAMPSVPVDHDLYYAARLAETILSGGMSGRLFTEVREKRGLVYHVHCHYQALAGSAGLFTYAGARPDLAQETLDVTVAELRRLAEGVTEEELARARVQAKSSLIMQGESTSARSAAIAGDYHHLGRLRSLEEISRAVDAVTAADVAAYATLCPAGNFTAVTLGPDPLDTACLDA